MAQIGLSVEDLARQLGAENVNLSGGRLEEGTRQYLVRTLNQFRSVSEIGDVIVSSRGGKPIYLKNVAHATIENCKITGFDNNIVLIDSFMQ